MLILILMLVLFVGVIRIGLGLAWGTMKLVFGLGLFWLCPLLFIAAAILGLFGPMLIPILVIGFLFGRRFARS